MFNFIMCTSLSFRAHASCEALFHDSTSLGLDCTTRYHSGHRVIENRYSGKDSSVVSMSSFCTLRSHRPSFLRAAGGRLLQSFLVNVGTPPQTCFQTIIPNSCTQLVWIILGPLPTVAKFYPWPQTSGPDVLHVSLLASALCIFFSLLVSLKGLCLSDIGCSGVKSCSSGVNLLGIKSQFNYMSPAHISANDSISLSHFLHL